MSSKSTDTLKKVGCVAAGVLSGVALFFAGYYVAVAFKKCKNTPRSMFDHEMPSK